ncbi:MAG: hypothetical protein ACD_66C00251G0003 [uncultured bacterium]|nr:MAG: hypothetical protein ACD_66C00251G0003 [uncultured bacterium]HLD45860.1 nucleotidyltransferase [bacterium]
MKNGEKNKPTLGSFSDERVLDVCRLLNDEGAEYLVIGGIAVQLHGVMRLTKDIDLLIPRDEKNAEKVIEALTNIGFGIARELSAEEVVKKPFTIIGDIPRVDLITVANKIKYSEAVETALQAKVDGVKIPYVGLDILIQTKKTNRHQDKSDIEDLEMVSKKKKLS